MSMPMRSTRSFCCGGLPSGSPSVAEVTPTLAQAPAPDRARLATPANPTRRRAARRRDELAALFLAIEISRERSRQGIGLSPPPSRACSRRGIDPVYIWPVLARRSPARQSAAVTLVSPAYRPSGRARRHGGLPGRQKRQLIPNITLLFSNA